MVSKVKKKFLSGILAVLSIVPSVSTFTSPALAADVALDYKNSEKSLISDVIRYVTSGVVGAASLGTIGYYLYQALNLSGKGNVNSGNTDNTNATSNLSSQGNANSGNTGNTNATSNLSSQGNANSGDTVRTNAIPKLSSQGKASLGNTDYTNTAFSLSEQGIPNLGNTCYMNATLQMLYRIPGFRRAVQSDNSGDRKAEAVKTIFKIIQKGEGAVKYADLVKAASELGYVRTQEDPSEFILRNIDSLTAKYGMQSFISVSAHIPTIGRKSFSMLELLEHGGNRNVEKVAEKVRKKYPNRVLSRKEINRLADGLSSEEQWETNSRLNIIPHDGQMLVYLNRTHFSDGAGAKDDVWVDCDIFYPGFALKGVVVHCGRGSIDRGHYVFFSRERDGWYLFDDNRVDKVSYHQVKNGLRYISGASRNGVLYLYERV